MTAVLSSKSSNKTSADVFSNISLTGELASDKSELFSTGSETENEPASSVKPQTNTMQSQDEELILNTDFDFHAPAFSPHHLEVDANQAPKRANPVVTDHVLENGERVVIVDPNVSEGEDNVDEESPRQLSPLDKAISSLFAAASNNTAQPIQKRKRSTSPNPKTVSAILATKRRKVEKPQKRPSDPNFSGLNDSLLASTSFLSALTSVPSTSFQQKPSGSRPSSSNSDLGTSKGSLSDSGIVSADEQQPILTPKQRLSPPKRSNEMTIPAPVLQLLASDPSVLKSINDMISAPKVEEENEDQPAFRQSVHKKTVQQQYPYSNQLNTLLSIVGCSNDQTTSNLLNNNEDIAIPSEVNEEDNQQELLRLGSEWLLRELFKGKSVDKPQPAPTQILRKRKIDSQSPQLKSSESVLSQLKSLKGQKQLAELEELEQFAAHFKRQRIKHGFTQGDVGVALGRRYGTDFSQTTISRFEALNLSFKNMCKLRPLMEEWLLEAESAIQRGYTVSDIVEAETLKNDREQHNRSSDSMDNSPTGSITHTTTGNLAKSVGTDLPHSSALSSVSPSGVVPGLSNVLPTLKKRRKRTNLDNHQKDKLEAYFIVNPRPDHQEMNRVANELDLDPDVVRVWFCNKRQKLRKN